MYFIGFEERIRQILLAVFANPPSQLPNDHPTMSYDANIHSQPIGEFNKTFCRSHGICFYIRGQYHILVARLQLINNYVINITYYIRTYIYMYGITRITIVIDL